MSAKAAAEICAAMCGTPAMLIVPVTHSALERKPQSGASVTFPFAASSTPATNPIVV